MNRLAVMLVAIASCFSLAGCPDGGDGGDPVVETCQKFDECNALNPGVSTQECVETLDKALDGLTETKQKDTRWLMRSCLQFESCDGFLSCVNSIDM